MWGKSHKNTVHAEEYTFPGAYSQKEMIRLVTFISHINKPLEGLLHATGFVPAP